MNTRVLKDLMKRRAKFILIGAFLGTVFAVFQVPFLMNIIMPWNKVPVLEIALDWGGLADLPSEDFKIQTEGDTVSRGITVQFKAEPEAIEDWISQSPGVDLSSLVESSNGQIKEYRVDGWTGLSGGTVKADLSKKEVFIDVAWNR